MQANSSVFNAAAVARLLGQGGHYTRLMIASACGRKKTTHVIEQIELAVMLGYINKYEGHDGVRACWFYTAERPLF